MRINALVIQYEDISTSVFILVNNYVGRNVFYYLHFFYIGGSTQYYRLLLTVMAGIRGHKFGWPGLLCQLAYFHWPIKKKKGLPKLLHYLALTSCYNVYYCNSLCVLQPPEPETPEVFENEVNKTPEPKPWISLGSEQEIEEESIKETRKKVLQYIKNT